MIKVIRSRHNKAVQDTAALKNKKYRTKSGFFVLEGAIAFKEALKCPEKLVRFFVQQELIEKYQDLLQFFIDKEGYQVSLNIMKQLCSTDNPQGILAVMKIPKNEMEKAPENGSFFLLDGISDPGNLGAIVRTAWAMDIQGVLLADHCADPFSPKSVRASMGGVLHVPIVEIDQNRLASLLEEGYSMYGAAANGSVCLSQIDLIGPLIVAIGNEAHGLSKWVLKLCKEMFFIPMNKQAESMNAAVAAGIIMNKMWQDRN